jgi:cysteinyl-tRNA synthetase
MGSEQLAREMTAHYVADTDRLELGRPDHEPRASEYVGPDRGADRGSRGARPRLRRRRRRLLRRALRGGVRRPLRPRRRRHGPGRGRRGRRSQARPARLRAVEGREGGGGHRLGRPLGPGAPGLAHRVLGDGRGAAGTGLRHPHGRGRPRLPAPRERGGADAGCARHAARPDLDPQRDDPDGGLGPGSRRRRPDGQDVQVGREHPRPRRGARRSGPRRPGDVPVGRPLPPAPGLRPRAPRRGRGPGGEGPGGGPAPRARRLPGGSGAAARRVLRRAGRGLQHGASTGRRVRVDPGGESPRGGRRRRAPARDAGRPGSRQPARPGDRRRATSGCLELAERRARARQARDFGEADRLRDALREAGWEVRDGAGGPGLVPAG